MTGRRLAIAGLVGVLVVGIVGAAAVASGVVRTGPSALPAPQLRDVAVASGVDHRYDGGYETFTGGGVAAFDCDEDHDPDLYLAGGAEPAALYRNETPRGGSLAFAPAGDATTDLTGVTGAYPLDIDADGHVDLAVLRVGASRILRGLG